MHDQRSPDPPAAQDDPPRSPRPVAPSIADGRERKPDPRSVQVDRIGGAIVAAFVCAALLVGVIVVALAGPFGLRGGLLLLGAWLVLGGSLTGLLVGWPTLRYRYTFYEVSGMGIRIRRGVLWRTVTTVPRSRVQHTDVGQGPVERAYGVATLVMYTAGTQNSSVALPGLAHETALAIRDHLIAGGEDDAV